MAQFEITDFPEIATLTDEENFVFYVKRVTDGQDYKIKLGNFQGLIVDTVSNQGEDFIQQIVDQLLPDIESSFEQDLEDQVAEAIASERVQRDIELKINEILGEDFENPYTTIIAEVNSVIDNARTNKKFSKEITLVNNTLDIVNNEKLPALQAELDNLNNTVLPEVAATIAQVESDLETLNNVDLPELDESLAELDTALNTLNGSTLPALELRLTQAEIDLQNLNAVDLTILQNELDQINVDLDTLNNTTLPALEGTVQAVQDDLDNLDLTALQNDLNAAQSDIDDLNDTVLPLVESRLSDVESSITDLNDNVLPDVSDTLDQVKDDLTLLDGRTEEINEGVYIVEDVNAIINNALTEIKAAKGISQVNSLFPIKTTSISDSAITTPLLAANSIVGSKIAAFAITGDKIDANTITGQKIVAGTLSAREIGALTITGDLIRGNTITADKLVVNSITADQIAAETITADELAANSINADKIVSGAVTTDKMTANSINGDRITANTINADKIVAGSISAREIAALSISGDEIKGNTISGDKIVANSVSGDKITANTLNGDRIVGRTISGDKIVANSITVDELAANSVNADKIVSGSISTDAMVANSINGDRIAANTLHADKIIANTISADQIKSNTITSDEIAALTITGDEIKGNTITGDKIVVNSIQADRIVSNSITSDQIAANTIIGDNILGNTITGDKIKANTITASLISSDAIETDAIKARAIVGDKLAVGTITGDLIAANTIQTNNLVVSDFENLAVNGKFTDSEGNPSDSQWTNIVVVSPPNISFYGNYTNAGQLDKRNSLNDNLFDVDKESEFYLSAYMVNLGCNFPSALGLQIKYSDGSVAFKKWDIGNQSSNGFKEGVIKDINHPTDPNNISPVSAKVWWNIDNGDQSVAITGAWRAANIVVRRRKHGQLIVDGTITATQIAAEAITATQLSADAIDGKLITGAILRTSSDDNVPRVVIGDPSFPLWYGTSVNGTLTTEDMIFGLLSNGTAYAQNLVIENNSVFKGELIAATGTFAGKLQVGVTVGNNETIEDLQGRVTTADTKATNAATNANSALSTLSNIAADDKLTPSEKIALKLEWDAIVSEYPEIVAEATRYSLSSDDYTSSYTSLSDYITPRIADLTTTSGINNVTITNRYSNYYRDRQKLLNSITTEAKKLADDAQSTADSASSAAATVSTELTTLKGDLGDVAYNDILSGAYLNPDMKASLGNIVYNGMFTNGLDDVISASADIIVVEKGSGGTVVDSAPSQKAARFPDDSSFSNIRMVTGISCSGGEEFYGSFYAGVQPTNTQRFQLRFDFLDSNGSTVFKYVAGLINSSQGWVKIEGRVTAPADTVRLTSIYLIRPSSDNTGGYGYVTAVEARRSVTGQQIVDGAIDLAKLGTTIIQGGYIKTDLLDVDTILGNNATFTGTITGANINGTTITGGLIRTAESGTRTEIENGTYMIYCGTSGSKSDANALFYVKKDGTGFIKGEFFQGEINENKFATSTSKVATTADHSSKGYDVDLRGTFSYIRNYQTSTKPLNNNLSFAWRFRRDSTVVDSGTSAGTISVIEEQGIYYVSEVASFTIDSEDTSNGVGNFNYTFEITSTLNSSATLRTTIRTNENLTG